VPYLLEVSSSTDLSDLIAPLYYYIILFESGMFPPKTILRRRRRRRRRKVDLQTRPSWKMRRYGLLS
jgi:hypothetical protein